MTKTRSRRGKPKAPEEVPAPAQGRPARERTAPQEKQATRSRPDRRTRAAPKKEPPGPPPKGGKGQAQLPQQEKPAAQPPAERSRRRTGKAPTPAPVPTPAAGHGGRERPIQELSNKLRLKLSPELLEQSLLHSSYVNERGDPRGSNERLEFLGDAVIDLAVTHYLYAQYPDADEGRLTKAKSVAVSRPMLSEKAEEIGLAPYLRLGKGEEANDGRSRVSNLGNAFEALVAMVFLEQGFTYAASFILRCLEKDIQRFLEESSATGDYKSLLQETAQRLFDCRPAYKIAEETGKEHHKEFRVTVSVSGHRAVGRGRSKKEAEQAAAKQLYLMLEEF